MSGDSGQALLYDKFYSRDGMDNSSFGSEPSKELRKLILMKFGKGRALDLGCGDGRNTLYLALQGYNVTAVDSSSSAIDKLKGKIGKIKIGDRIKPICQDVRDYDFPDKKFNLAVAITLFDHLPEDDIERIFKNTVESMADRAVLLAKVHTIDDPGANGDTEHASELANMVQHYFRRSEFYNLASKYLQVLDYKEVSEVDNTHGKPHRHCFAILKGRKEDFE